VFCCSLSDIIEAGGGFNLKKEYTSKLYDGDFIVLENVILIGTKKREEGK
jgi:hypothetical protein